MRPDLPSGTVTFLFTDVEGSTRLLHELGADAYAETLAEHRRVIRRACTAEDGVEVDTQGDAFFFAFPTAPGAIAAAAALTDALAGGLIQVRVGLHTGIPLLTAEGYVGDDVHVGARIASSAHGGQVLLSAATAAFVQDLLTELGEHRLKDLEGPVAIFQLGDERFPPLKTISNTNLPRPASSFVGRERELADVLERIEQGARLLTLSGPGGTGKTRLALEAATTLVPEYKAGVFWVGLASLRDPALVSETIAQTLGAKDGLAEHIAEREMLLLLDNLEQVAECARELSALLQTCPNLTLLVTSRELLRIQGELEYEVPPLAEAEAVSLFCARSQLEPSQEIAALCSRLDSLPLAVELAAARTKALTPAQILERLSGRLDLLKGGRDAEPRQQTLGATIEWSYDLLSEDEQGLFRRLSVFSGGCTLEAAEVVAVADLDTLQSLVEKSLLRFSQERYWMLETIKEYALERLQESDAGATAGRHTDYFLALAEEVYPEARGPDPAPSFDRLEREHDNLRATIARVRQTGESELELRLAVALASFWRMRGYLAEGRLNLTRALASAGNSPLRARALHGAGFIAYTQGRHEEAEALLEEGWRLARQSDDVELTSHLLLTLAGTVSERDEMEAAALYAELQELVEEHGEERFPPAFLNLGDFALRQGDYARAVQQAEKCLRFLGEEGDLWLRALALGNLGLAQVGLGRVTEARAALVESLRLHEAMGDKQGIAAGISMLALVIAERGETERAARLLAYSEWLLREIEADLPRGFEGELHERALARVRAEVSDLEIVWSQGEKMTLRAAVAEAVGDTPTP